MHLISSCCGTPGTNQNEDFEDLTYEDVKICQSCGGDCIYLSEEDYEEQAKIEILKPTK